MLLLFYKPVVDAIREGEREDEAELYTPSFNDRWFDPVVDPIVNVIGINGIINGIINVINPCIIKRRSRYHNILRGVINRKPYKR